MTPRFAYTVTATLPDEPTAQRFADWLLNGHTQAVIEAGAASAEVARLDPDPDHPGIRIQTHYTFPSRAHYDTYVQTAAPALRADGIARFGDVAQFERSLGEILS